LEGVVSYPSIHLARRKERERKEKKRKQQRPKRVKKELDSIHVFLESSANELGNDQG